MSFNTKHHMSHFLRQYREYYIYNVIMSLSLCGMCIERSTVRIISQTSYVTILCLLKYIGVRKQGKILVIFQLPLDICVYTYT